MQKLILSVLLTSLLFTISKAQNSKEKIGISKNGKLVITSSLKKIKNEWAEILKDNMPQFIIGMIMYICLIFLKKVFRFLNYYFL